MFRLQDHTLYQTLRAITIYTYIYVHVHGLCQLARSPQFCCVLLANGYNSIAIYLRDTAIYSTNRSHHACKSHAHSCVNCYSACTVNIGYIFKLYRLLYIAGSAGRELVDESIL